MRRLGWASSEMVLAGATPRAITQRAEARLRFSTPDADSARRLAVARESFRSQITYDQRQRVRCVASANVMVKIVRARLRAGDLLGANAVSPRYARSPR